MANPSQLKEIAESLRQLQQSSPTTSDEVGNWSAAARRFTNWHLTAFPDVRLPTQVMFYLHDADIRVKDPEYRKNQDEMLSKAIASLERGVVPDSPGKSIILHPRWLGAVALVILAIVGWVAR